MICKFCNEKMPDPEPKVVVKEVQVDRSDSYYQLRMFRWAALVILMLSLGGMVNCGWHRHLESKEFEAIIKDPMTKVEIREEPGRSVDKKFTREAQK